MLILAVGLSCVSIAEKDSDVLEYSIQEGGAIKTLKQAARQAGEIEILYSARVVKGQRTQAVMGLFSLPEALGQMLEGTQLEAVPVSDGEAYAIMPRAKKGGNVPERSENQLQKTSTKKLEEELKMNLENERKQNGLLKTLAAVLTLGIAGTEVQVRAQDDSSGEEQIFELSPFTIDADDNDGYSATQTILGGRLKQKIKDIPSQIEIITAEMMEDFGLTSLDDAFRYSTNVENGEEFVPFQAGGSETIAWSGQSNGRIRGIYSSQFSTARNLFSSITRSDSYNTSRMAIASGAQSLYFSIGQPAGSANITLKNAQMRDFGSVALQVESEDGYRATVDLNRELIDDKLSFRFAGLTQDRPSFIKPNYNKDSRAYGTFTFRPIEKTTIRIHAEGWSSSNNNPVTQFPWDFASPAYDALQQNDLSLVPLSGPDRGLWPVLFGGNYEGTLDYFHVGGWRTVAGPGTLPFWPERYGSARDPNAGVARLTFSPETAKLFPEVEANIGKNFLGETTKNIYDSSIYNASVEHRILENLTFELAAHNEDWERRTESGQRVNNSAFYADVNEYIPNVANSGFRRVPNADTPNYVPNPNFGKLYSRGVPNGHWREEGTDEYRASLAWEPNAPESARWLGQHSFLAAFNTRESFSKQNDILSKILNPNIEYSNYGGPLSGSQRLLFLNHYFDEGENSTFKLPIEGLTLSELYSGISITEPISGEALELSSWDKENSSFRLAGTLSNVDSSIFSWQGNFGERVLMSYGFRRDDASLEKLDVGASGPNRNADNQTVWFKDAVFDGSGFVGGEEDSHTYGIVARPTKAISLSYYQSNTVNISSGWLTPFGEDIKGANGESKDYSIRFDSADGNFYIKLNKYDLVQKGDNVGFGLVRIDALRLERAYAAVVNENDADDASTSTYEQLYFGEQGFSDFAVSALKGLNDGTYPVIGNRTADGYELTAGLAVGNWDFRFNAAKNETLNSSASSEWENWLDNRVAVYEQLRDIDGQDWSEITYQGPSPENYNILLPDGSSRTMTMKEFYEQVTLGQLDAALQLNNQPVDTSRKYRANLNASYRFNEGNLKGLRAGGAIRWRSAPILGFSAKDSGRTNGGFPVPALDLSSPYDGEELLDADLFASYSGKNFFGTDMGYRVQFNVRNVTTGEDSYSSSKVNALGESVFTWIETPRSYSLSLRLDF